MQQLPMFKLDQSRGGRGLCCDHHGLFWGRVALLQKDGDGSFDANGVPQILVGTSEPMGYLRPGTVLNPGEILAPGLGHAEADVVDFAAKNGLKLLEVGATRPICPACGLKIKNVGATSVTPLKVH